MKNYILHVSRNKDLLSYEILLFQKISVAFFLVYSTPNWLVTDWVSAGAYKAGLYTSDCDDVGLFGLHICHNSILKNK